LSVNGRIELRRIRWHAPGEGSDTPLDRLLDAAEATVSVGVRQLGCQLALSGGSFARSRQNLLKAAQIPISEELLRQVVEAEGQAVLAAHRDEQLEAGFTASACKTLTPQGQELSRVYVSADGVMVPLTTQQEKQKRRATVLRQRRKRRGKRRRLGAVKKGADQRYKQFYVSAIYDQRQTRRLVSVTRGDHRQLKKQLRRDAARVRLRGASERIGLIDGAVCLRTHLEQLPLEAVGLDFYHLSEHVEEGKRATFAQKEAAEAWAGEVLHTVKHEGYAPFWQQLVRWRAQQRRRPSRQAADGLLHYVAQRKEMINYGQFLQKGWDIGSGPIESMCKATTQRLKGPGMRWDSDNAEAMMSLEALHQSHLWDSYWAMALTAGT
jgi:hypothetical protein